MLLSDLDVNKYSSMVTDTMCRAHNISPTEKTERAILAWNILNPNDPIQEHYYVMNKNRIVMEFDLITEQLGNEAAINIRIFEHTYIKDLTLWLESRKIAKHRKQLESLMRSCHCDSIVGLISITHCASLTDTLWVKRSDSNITWEQVNLYTNPFDETIAKIAFNGLGVYGQQFTSTTPEFSTEGSFEKCWIRDDKNDVYMVKRGTEGFANAGMEPYSEALYTQIASCFDISFTKYTLVKYHSKLASRCKLFTNMNLSLLPAARYMDDVGTIEGFYKYYSNLGFQKEFATMLILDSLTLNCDRHPGNFGFLVNSDTFEIIKPAPLYDFNLSCLPYIMKTDNVTDYINEHCEPKIGKDFVYVAKAVLTSELRTTLINLKSFDYTNPGFGFPKWRVKMLNDIKDQMIKDILG